MVIPIAVNVGVNGRIAFANFATNLFVQTATTVKTKGVLNHIIVVVKRMRSMIHTKEKNHAHALMGQLTRLVGGVLDE